MANAEASSSLLSPTSPSQPKPKSSSGLSRFAFRARSKKDQTQLQHRTSVNRRGSVARKSSTANRRNSRRTSVAQRRRSKRVSTGPNPRPTSIYSPTSPSMPADSPKVRSGGFLRRLTRHFTSKKPTPQSAPSQSAGPTHTVQQRKGPLSPELKPSDIKSTVPEIVAPREASPAPKKTAERGRSKSPAPSATSKRSQKRPASPGRESLASFRYPPLPPSPLPVPVSSPSSNDINDTLSPVDTFKLSTPSLLEAINFDNEHATTNANPVIPTSPSLVHSDSESSHGCGPQSPETDGSPTITRGRQPHRALPPKKESASLLSVPGSEDVPALVDDDDDAWTDDERVRSRSREPVLPLITEEPMEMKESERKGLSLIVSTSDLSKETSVFSDSPILEKVDEEEDDDDTPNTAGIDFVLPSMDEEDPPLKTSQSEQIQPRSRTLSNRSLGATPANVPRRASMFSRLFSPKKETFSPTATESPERRTSGDKVGRRLSINRGSTLEARASMLPKRSPTVRTMTNADINRQMETLRTNRQSLVMSPASEEGVKKALEHEDESARLTEAAFF